MKRWLLPLLLLVWCSLLSLSVSAESKLYMFRGGEGETGTADSAVQQLEDALPNDLLNALPDHWQEGNSASFSFRAFMKSAVGAFRQFLLPAAGAAARLLAVLLIAALFYGFRDAVSGELIRSALELAVSAGTVLAIMQVELSVVGAAEQCVKTVCYVMNLILPTLGAVCLSGGAVSLAALTGTEMVAFVTVTGNLFSAVILPLGGMCLALASVGSLGGIRLRAVSKCLIAVAGVLIAVLMFAFTCFLNVQTHLAAAGDSLRMQGVRFAVSSFIPLVGGALADAVGTLTGSLTLIRSTVGGVGIVLLLTVTVPPLLNLLLNRIVLFIGKAAADLLGCEREAGLLEEIGKVFTFLTATVCAVSALFVISLALCVSVAVGGKAL